jgi:hypothetical protein
MRGVFSVSSDTPIVDKLGRGFSESRETILPDSRNQRQHTDLGFTANRSGQQHTKSSEAAGK